MIAENAFSCLDLLLVRPTIHMTSHEAIPFDARYEKHHHHQGYDFKLRVLYSTLRRLGLHAEYFNNDPSELNWRLILHRSNNTHVATKLAALGTAPIVGLSTLPTELVTMIFGHLEIEDNLFAIVCLSLTCKSMFSLGYACLLDRHKRSAHQESWAGDRVICLGEHTMLQNLPTGVLTSQERSHIIRQASQIDQCPHGRGSTRQCKCIQERIELFSSEPERIQHDFSTLIDSSYRCEWRPKKPGLFSDMWFWAKMKNAGLLEPKEDPLDVEQTRLLELLAIEDMNEFSLSYSHLFEDPYGVGPNAHQHEVVLCSYTAGEYVRAGAFPQLYKGLDAKSRKKLEKKYDINTQKSLNERTLGFGGILATMIGCSPHAASEGFGLHEGRWAGHRLEITTMERMREVQCLNGWKDISAKVMKKMRDFGRDFWGKDWADQI